MPFASLPSSPGFQLPPAPRWEQFASQAIEGIRNRPVINTAAMVEKAADQINNIIQKHSPEAQMERRMKMAQLRAMHLVWTDFEKHPQKYQMTAHGPVLIDPLARTERVLRINESAERIRTSQGKRNTLSVIQKLSDREKQQGIEDVDEDAPSGAEALPGDEPKAAPDNTGDAAAPDTAIPTQPSDSDTAYYAPEEPFNNVA